MTIKNWWATRLSMRFWLPFLFPIDLIVRWKNREYFLARNILHKRFNIAQRNKQTRLNVVLKSFCAIQFFSWYMYTYKKQNFRIFFYLYLFHGHKCEQSSRNTAKTYAILKWLETLSSAHLSCFSSFYVSF